MNFKILLGIVIVSMSCSRKNTSHQHQVQTAFDPNVNGIYEVCLNVDCTTPYGIDPIYSAHDIVKVVNGRFVQSKHGYMTPMIGEPFIDSYSFTEINCDYGFTVIRFMNKININDTLPFHE